MALLLHGYDAMIAREHWNLGGEREVYSGHAPEEEHYWPAVAVHLVIHLQAAHFRVFCSGRQCQKKTHRSNQAHAKSVSEWKKAEAKCPECTSNDF